MQKVNQIVTIKRIFAAALPFAVLFCSIVGTAKLIPPPSIVRERGSTDRKTVRIQTVADFETQQNAVLNNEPPKNANPTKEQTSCEQNDAAISETPCRRLSCDTVRVYIADTGEIRTMPLEDYVLCAVLGEMPQTFGTEALKAQAVAARTMAVYLKTVETNKHADCDICTDYRHCQSFLDAENVTFDITAARNAVASTKGVIAVYDGKPILAAYHASSGRTTNSAGDVWGGDLSYLVPVMAPENADGEKRANGHGVGMSQYGAKALAESGYDYLSILRYYYTGITLGFLENDV